MIFKDKKMEAKKIFHDVFQNIEVGIGEVSKTVGVSQRQLRYWEEKGYIKPVADNQSGVRRYTLSTLYLIIFIKTQLDQGFTLSAAFERSKDIKVKSKIVRNFFRDLICFYLKLMKIGDLPQHKVRTGDGVGVRH